MADLRRVPPAVVNDLSVADDSGTDPVGHFQEQEILHFFPYSEQFFRLRRAVAVMIQADGPWISFPEFLHHRHMADAEESGRIQYHAFLHVDRSDAGHSDSQDPLLSRADLIDQIAGTADQTFPVQFGEIPPGPSENLQAKVAEHSLQPAAEDQQTDDLRRKSGHLKADGISPAILRQLLLALFQKPFLKKFRHNIADGHLRKPCLPGKFNPGHRFPRGRQLKHQPPVVGAGLSEIFP